jgi:hypothetical protein
MRFAAVLLLGLPLYAQPHLLLDSADLSRIHKLAAAEPWAAAVVRGLEADAAGWPAAHVREFGLSEWALPQEGAGWSHAYVCPEHGVRLTQKAGKNLCPIDGKDYHGWPVDNVVYMQRNDDNARAARDLGLAWRLTGKPEFTEKARRIFRAYADLYPTLPIHDNNNKLDTKAGARVMSQTLSEAKWLVPLAFGYDLVREAVPAAERERFETNVLRNAAAVIARNDAGKSNWQSWHNAALLAVGLIVNDRALVNLAVSGPSGFRFQLREGITADGPWHEGSWGYHFFALEPLLLTREMAERAGVLPAEAAALKRMLDAPLVSIFPDGTLPDFNDSGNTRLSAEARYYEIGYRLFHDPSYAIVWRGQKRGLESLLWGAESLPSGGAVELPSKLLPDAGVAVLRVRGSDHTVAVKFGPHGGGHGHYDKLSFVSYANGAHLAADPGTQAYAAPTHTTWDKMTVAHNTIAVDERTQAAATGRLLHWTGLPHVSMIAVSADGAYPGIALERTLVHTAGYTLDIATARAGDSAAHRFDWLYHNFGKVSVALPLRDAAELPKSNGYQHLVNGRESHTGEDWQATFTQAGSNLRVIMLAAQGTTVVSGEGLGPDLRVPVPFVMARRQGAAAAFTALYEPYKSAPSVKSLRRKGGSFTIESAGATDTITMEGGRFEFLRAVNGKPVRLALDGVARHEWMELSRPASVEVEWLESGVVEVWSGADGLTFRVRAPGAKAVRVNGAAVEFRREGEFVAF